MILAVVLALQAANAAVPSRDRDVVVTAKRIDDSAAALDACIARRCPPDEDADASIGYAQAQFVAGDYVGARRTLGAAIGRTKGGAKAYPVAVADLWMVQSRIASHLGEAEQYRGGMLRSIEALRAGLPRDDPRVFAQRLDLGDVKARLGDSDGAFAVYAGVERDARKAGQDAMRGMAMLKTAMLYGVLAENDPVFGAQARQAIRTLADAPDVALRPFAEAAAILSARLDIRGKGGPALDDLVARYRNSAAAEPVLLFAPPIALPRNLLASETGSVTGKLVIDAAFADQWVDIRFRIGANGAVEDAAILHRSPALRDDWLAPVFRSIRGRRYAPLARGRTAGTQRVERYTLTANWGVVTASRVRRRSADLRIAMLDLTPPPATAIPR